MRSFTHAEHLDIWSSGRCRLRLASYYRKLETDVRKDDGEGEARHIVLGANNTPVSFSGSVHNPIYVLSFSERDAPSITSRRYGSYLSHVDAVETLVKDLTDALTRSPIGTRDVSSVVLLRVKYSRDTIIDPEPTREERWNLMVSQKDQRDADDREWRVVVTLSGPVAGAPEELWFDFAPRSLLVAPAV